MNLMSSHHLPSFGAPPAASTAAPAAFPTGSPPAPPPWPVPARRGARGGSAAGRGPRTTVDAVGKHQRKTWGNREMGENLLGHHYITPKDYIVDKLEQDLFEMVRCNVFLFRGLL